MNVRCVHVCDEKDLAEILAGIFDADEVVLNWETAMENVGDHNVNVQGDGNVCGCGDGCACEKPHDSDNGHEGTFREMYVNCSERARKLESLTNDLWKDARLMDANGHIDGLRVSEPKLRSYVKRLREVGIDCDDPFADDDSATGALRGTLTEMGAEWAVPNSCERNSLTLVCVSGADVSFRENLAGRLEMVVTPESDLSVEEAIGWVKKMNGGDAR